MNDDLRQNSWITLSVTINTQQRELAMEEAFQAGALGVVEQEDGFEASFSFDDAVQERLIQYAQRLRVLDPDVNLDQRNVDWENWNATWQEYFQPLVIEPFEILPEWRSPEHPDCIPIFIRPAMAFGTGTHETTGLCLQLLGQVIDGDERVLDVGTGSGILGIAALKLGARQVDGIDIDPLVSENVRENLEINDLGAGFKLQITDDPVLAPPYDVLVVNMIRKNLFPVLPRYFDQVRKAGTVIISGLLTEESGMLDHLLSESRWQIEERTTHNDWMACRCRVI